MTTVNNVPINASFSNSTRLSGADLMTVSRIIGDESGRYSMEEKGAAFRQYAGMIGNTSNYTIEQKREASELRDNSSFMKKIREMHDVITGASGFSSTSSKLTAKIDALDSIPPEDLALNPDYDGLRERWVVQRQLFQIIESREEAGTYKPGTPIGSVTDSQAKMALEMLKQIDDVYSNYRSNEQKTEDVKPVLASIRERLGIDAEGNRSGGSSSSSNWQDSVTLSPAAQRILDRG